MRGVAFAARSKAHPETPIDDVPTDYRLMEDVSMFRENAIKTTDSAIYVSRSFRAGIPYESSMIHRLSDSGLLYVSATNRASKLVFNEIH